MSANHCLSLPSLRRGWLSVIAITLATFAVVTTEMLPVGLLSPIAADFDVPQAQVSLLLTIPAIVATLCSPLVILFAGQLNRRSLLMLLMALLMLANISAAFAGHFYVLVAARIIVGLSIGGIWAIAGGIAVRLLPARSVAAATSLIFGGVAAASVLGIPAGIMLGELTGWRGVFTIMSAFSLAILLLQMVCLPSLPCTHAPAVSRFITQWRRPVIRTGLFITLLLVTGHFMIFTFIRPLLHEDPQLQPQNLSGLLALYGIAGIAGNFLFGLLAGRHLYRAVFCIITGIILTLAGLLFLPPVMTARIPLVILWGLTYGGVSVVLMTWMIRFSAPDIEITGALYIAFFNAGIAAGSAAGGMFVSSFSLQGDIRAALGCVLAALLLTAVFIIRSRRACASAGKETTPHTMPSEY
ncbi:MFS transporter [Morganella psychrotolerans]|uniref:MFS transporter n=1 Tax=Morganella psychrotolerans TaxID=368603 RepID=A0A5M9R9N4_9GAMM|nr:MFS transporter [Morganella psychrotolerans]KAA8717263.1 MFS transporter [Morganella psychrotolerans]OBU09226.1 integral membrane transport protein [Morganella psychrotolerans]